MRRMAFAGFAVTIVMLVLVLVPGIGKEANGSRGWFVVAGFSMQPSELAKIALRDLGRASAGRATHGTGVAAGDADSAGPGRGHRAGADRRAARPRPDRVAGHHPAGPALVRRPAAAGLPELAVRRDRRGRRCWRCRRVTAPTGCGPGWTRAQIRRTPDIRLGRRSSRWPTAGFSATAWGRAPRNGTTCPTRTTTSSSRSSARNSGLVGALGLLALFGLFAYTGMRIARRSADPFLRLLTATTTMWVIGQVVHQRRLRDRPAARHRPPAAADLCRWNINGHNTFDDRHDGKRGPARTRGGRRAPCRTRRPDEPPAAAADAGALLADPGRGAARPVAQQGRSRASHRASAKRKTR